MLIWTNYQTLQVVIEVAKAPSYNEMFIPMTFEYMVNVLKFCTPKFLAKTKWHMQTTKTKIRVLLQELSVLGLHCMPFDEVF